MFCARFWPLRRSRADHLEEARNDDRGLKLLYAGESPRVDIVAVHGLNGHREGSWTASNQENWLKDFLPADCPDARISTWGYDMSTRLPGRKALCPREVSKALVSDLWEMRELRKSHLPIIFIAHSLGGTMVKSALLYSTSAQEPCLHHHSISIATHGVVFIDTPELDTSLSGLQAFLNHIEPNNQDQNVQEARWLLETLENYASMGDTFQSVLVKARPDNNTTQNSFKDKDSQGNPSSIVVDRDHANVNKFDSARDQNYVKIRDLLLHMTASIKSNAVPG